MAVDNKDKLTPLKAIKIWCLECSCGNYSEVRNCIIQDCCLFPYRQGKNPKRKGIGKRGV